MEYKGYNIELTAPDKKFKVTNDDLEGTVRDSWEQITGYIDRTIAGRGKLKRDKIALRVLAKGERWHDRDDLTEQVITGIHMGTGRVLPRFYEFYPATDKVRKLVGERKQLDKQLREKEEELRKYIISGDRKPRGYGVSLDPEHYSKYIKALVDEYEKKAKL